MKLFKRKPKKMTDREKVEERREEVLSKGRKFKYPVQYAKHNVVLVTIAISIAFVALTSVLIYFSLYKWQNTNDILYHITEIMPLPVAKIDGEKVEYYDYLLIYRSSITPVIQQQGANGDANSESMREHFKREALTSAEDYTYAMKLAREMNITVSDEEVDKAVNDHRKVGGVERSTETFERILQDNFGITMKEYRRLVYMSLVKQKVSEQIDDAAKNVVSEVEKLIKDGKSLGGIAEQLGKKVSYEETGGLVDKMNVDGGRSTVALGLEKGKISSKFLSSSGDGYYFVKLIDKTDNSVNYTSIKISFTEFDKRVKDIRNRNLISEYITVVDNSAEQNE